MWGRSVLMHLSNAELKFASSDRSKPPGRILRIALLELKLHVRIAVIAVMDKYVHSSQPRQQLRKNFATSPRISVHLERKSSGTIQPVALPGGTNGPLPMSIE
jgi:hypothetical protein